MINPRIIELLEQMNVPEKDGIAYLLAVYYDCIPSYIPTLLIQRVNITNILGYKNNEIVWNEPLFLSEDKDSPKWAWVSEEYMELFAACNPKRKGTKSSCISRMKSFFAQNPEVRKEDIIGATQMYINSVSNPEYLITSHYFITKDKGKDRTSALEEWLERYLNFKAITPDVTSDDLTSRLQ